nr:hypothetical protein CFP56_64842 [Quercus suber]
MASQTLRKRRDIERRYHPPVDPHVRACQASPARIERGPARRVAAASSTVLRPFQTRNASGPCILSCPSVCAESRDRALSCRNCRVAEDCERTGDEVDACRRVALREPDLCSKPVREDISFLASWCCQRGLRPTFCAGAVGMVAPCCGQQAVPVAGNRRARAYTSTVIRRR